MVINARSTAEGDGTYVKIADLMNQVDSRFPGAVWSLSIGWGCDKLLTATDLAPVRPRWPVHTRTEPSPSTPAATSRGWKAREATMPVTARAR